MYTDIWYELPRCRSVVYRCDENRVLPLYSMSRNECTLWWWDAFSSSTVREMCHGCFSVLRPWSDYSKTGMNWQCRRILPESCVWKPPTCPPQEGLSASGGLVQNSGINKKMDSNENLIYHFCELSLAGKSISERLMNDYHPHRSTQGQGTSAGI